MNTPSDADAGPKCGVPPRLHFGGCSGWSCGFPFILILIGCNLFGMLMALVLPQIQAARETKRRARCVENLEQIGLAMQSYHQQYGCFPPSFIPDEDGEPKHSWRVLLLPHLGERDLYARYRFDEPWDGPHNIALGRQMPAVYHCPSNPDSGPSQTSYAMIVGPHAISDGPAARRISDITDGPANTIMVAEAPMSAIDWMEPRDLIAETMDPRTSPVEKGPRPEPCEIFRLHHAVVNLLFCDGSVQTLHSQSVFPERLEALMTIDGGEPQPLASPGLPASPGN